MATLIDQVYEVLSSQTTSFDREAISNYLSDELDLSSLEIASAEPLEKVSTLEQLYQMNEKLVKYNVYITDILEDEIYPPKGKGKWTVFKEYIGEDEIEKEHIILTQRQVCYAIPVPQAMSQRTKKGSGKTTPSKMEEEKKKITLMPGVSADIDEPLDQATFAALKQKGIIQNGQNEADMFPCLLKVYGKNKSLIKIRGEFQVTGFLYIDSAAAPIPTTAAPAPQPSEDIFTKDSQEQSGAFPTNIVPRLHVVKMCPLNETPILPAPASTSVPVNLEGLVNLFSEACGGDRVAGLLLIVALASRVVSRQMSMPINILNINLMNCEHQLGYSNMPKGISIHDLLNRILAQIEPRASIVQMSLDQMNKEAFSAKKDYERNCLSPCHPLSLNQPLLIDECYLTQGQLNKQGVENLDVFNSIIRNQIINTDFQYYKLPIESSIPVISLSQGKSILEHEIKHKIQPVSLENCSPELLSLLEKPSSGSFVDSDQLAFSIGELIRSSKARLSQLNLTEAFCNEVQQYFMNSREEATKNSSKLATPEELSNWVSVCKIITALKGKEQPSMGEFEEAISMFNGLRE